MAFLEHQTSPDLDQSPLPKAKPWISAQAACLAGLSAVASRYFRNADAVNIDDKIGFLKNITADPRNKYLEDEIKHAKGWSAEFSPELPGLERKLDKFQLANQILGEYYIAAFGTENSTAEIMIRYHLEQAKTDQAWTTLARYYFMKGEYLKANKYLENVEDRAQAAEQLADLFVSLDSTYGTSSLQSPDSNGHPSKTVSHHGEPARNKSEHRRTSSEPKVIKKNIRKIA